MAPYRQPLFDALRKHRQIELVVYYCAQTEKGRKWGILEKHDCTRKILLDFPIRFKDITIHNNPSLVKHVAAYRPNVVIIDDLALGSTMWIAWGIAKLTRTPVILWSEKFRLVSSARALEKLVYPLERMVARNCQAIIVPGAMSKRFYEELGIPSHTIFIAPDCIDNYFYIKNSLKFQERRESLRRALGWSDKLVVLYVGQLIKRKGLIYLLRAYANLWKRRDDILLVIVGDGPLKTVINAFSKKYPITFVGYVDEIEKIKLYSIADVFVMPTLHDVWGMTINEAMACGLPVISTRTAGAAKDMIINGVNGFIVKEGNASDLYFALNKIICNKQILVNMKRICRETVEHRFALTMAAQGFLEAITYAVKGNA